MPQESLKENIDKSVTERPKSIRVQRYAGPQGTKVYEGEDLKRIRSRLVKLHKAATRQPSLLGVTLPFTGRRFLLKAGTSLIGRAIGNDIVLNDPGVSSIHAKIIHEDGDWRVLNLLSTNGTFINGNKQIISSLKLGDRVRFGRTEFLFDYEDKLLSTKAPASRSPRLLWWLTAGVALLAMVAVLIVLV